MGKKYILYRQAIFLILLITICNISISMSKIDNLPASGEEMLAQLARDPRKTHPYRVGILARQAQRFSALRLKQSYRAAAEAHRQLVTSSRDPGMVLEVLLVRTLSGRRARKRSQTP